MSWSKTALSLSLALLLGGPLLAKPKTVSLAELTPTPAQGEAAHWVSKYLTRLHYASKPLDDAMSAQILKRYIEALDSEKVFFLKADIEGFERRYASFLDDAIESRQLDVVYEIYKRYLQRLRERTDYARTLLDQGFDFDVDEEYLYDRKDAQWAAGRAELDEHWRQRVKNDWLRLKLAKREDARIADTLDKRYRDYLLRVEQLDRQDVFQTFLNAYAMAIEPHTNYLGPRASENFQISMRLSLEGIGAVLQREGEFVVVRSVVEGGPAALGGKVKVGDRIVAVGQAKDAQLTDVVGWRLEDVVDLIRGPKDTLVKLEVLAAESSLAGKSQLVEIVRDKVKLEEQAAHKRVIEAEGRKIGVIELPAFYLDFAARARGDLDYRSSTRDVRKLIGELRREKVEAILIDLRNNGGGSLAEATELTGLFIDQGPVVQVRDGHARVQVESDTARGLSWAGPLAVLVNRASASASEIFAAAIQDYGRGIVIGEPTFGKGTVQQLVDLDYIANKDKPELGQLKLTMAQFFRVDGGSTQHRGVLPDLRFPATLDAADYGESTYDNALPWTRIAAASYAPVGDFTRLVPLLATRHEERVAKDPEFGFLLEDIEQYRSSRGRKSISLNYAKREAERKADEARIAARAKARGEAADKLAESLDDGLNPGERGALAAAEDEEAKADKPDVLLTEGARVLADAVELLAENPRIAEVGARPARELLPPGS
ncbi:MAG: carboxy terminal-processing peptidase [Xanthomonadales bacterium]|nr:Tail-specific protease [Xanthomonadales bacterium]MCC6593870.1 carboxy terminal-processing peptidase [Xanthomonadales bacterium]MCE7931039.1 tail-specific protease [Xanthomonadales bacterium PRO6]